MNYSKFIANELKVWGVKFIGEKISPAFIIKISNPRHLRTAKNRVQVLCETIASQQI